MVNQRRIVRLVSCSRYSNRRSRLAKTCSEHIGGTSSRVDERSFNGFLPRSSDGMDRKLRSRQKYLPSPLSPYFKNSTPQFQHERRPQLFGNTGRIPFTEMLGTHHHLTFFFHKLNFPPEIKIN